MVSQRASFPPWRTAVWRDERSVVRCFSLFIFMPEGFQEMKWMKWIRRMKWISDTMYDFLVHQPHFLTTMCQIDCSLWIAILLLICHSMEKIQLLDISYIFHSLPRNISRVPQCSSLPGSIQVLYRSYWSEMWLMFAVHYTWVEPQAVWSDLDFFVGFESSAKGHVITVRLWNTGKTALTVKLHSFSKGQDVSF